jgi:hypothetical protein
LDSIWFLPGCTHDKHTEDETCIPFKSPRPLARSVFWRVDERNLIRPKVPFFDTKFSFKSQVRYPKAFFGTKFAFKKSKCNEQIKCSSLLHCSPKVSPMFDCFHKYSPSLDPFVDSSCTLSQSPADGASSSEIRPQARWLTGFLTSSCWRNSFICDSCSTCAALWDCSSSS